MPIIYNKNFTNISLLSLKYCGLKTPINFELYTPQKLVNFVSSPSAFGTAYVAWNIKDYNDFINNYNTEKIVNLDIFDGQYDKGFNALFLCPENLNFCKHYEKIVFLSPVLDTGIISKLNELTTAKIYLPINKKAFNNAKYVDLSRSTYVKIFNALKRFKGFFIGLEDLYTKLNLPFNYETFLVCFLTLQDLSIIKIENDESVKKLIVNDTIKSALTNSNLYNTVNLLKNLTEK